MCVACGSAKAPYSRAVCSCPPGDADGIPGPRLNERASKREKERERPGERSEPVGAASESPGMPGRDGTSDLNTHSHPHPGARGPQEEEQQQEQEEERRQ